MITLMDASVQEFILLCRQQGLHFTASWVEKRVKQLEQQERKTNDPSEQGDSRRQR